MWSDYALLGVMHFPVKPTYDEILAAQMHAYGTPDGARLHMEGNQILEEIMRV